MYTLITKSNGKLNLREKLDFETAVRRAEQTIGKVVAIISDDAPDVAGIALALVSKTEASVTPTQKEKLDIFSNQRRTDPSWKGLDERRKYACAPSFLKAMSLGKRADKP